MSIKVTDRLIGKPRGSADAVLVYAARWYAPNGDKDITEYVREVYRVAPMAGIDPAIVVSQSVLETSDPVTGRPWASKWWRERLNPAGMGVTGDPAENELSPRFEDARHAARAHVAHLLVYAVGPNDAGIRWSQRVMDGWPFREIDPRYEAYLAAYGNRAMAETIGGLTGKWAVDLGYADKIVARAADVFGPTLPDQEETMPDAFPFDQRITTRDLGVLTSTQAYITIHNNGNPTSDRFDEAAFVQNGGGSQGVLYHGAIDAGGVVQIEKLDHRGIHSGNTVGNATSIAFEMCVGSEPWATVKEYTAQLLAEIVTNRRGILDYGTFGPANFSLDRVVEHRDWGRTVGVGAGLGNPACPARLIETDGGVEKIVARAREIVSGWHPGPSPYPVQPVAVPDELRAQGHVLSVNGSPRFRCIQGGRFRTGPSREAPEIAKPSYRAGARYRFEFAADVNGERWLASRRGSWALARNFEVAA